MGVIRRLGNIGSKILNETSDVVGAMGYAGDKVVGGAAKATRKTFFKKTEPSLQNAYLGYESNKVANIGAGVFTVGLVAAGGAFGAAKMPGLEGVESRTSKAGTVSYGGAPSIMEADGVGTPSKAPTLGATGSLVFGLHNGRKG